MKVNELIGYKSNPIYSLIKDFNFKNDDSIPNLYDVLKDNGYKKEILGFGTYGLVFAHPNDPSTVIKFFLSKDTGYKRYLNFVLSNQNNPHVPKVKGKPASLMQGRIQMIRLERLRGYNEGSDLDNKFFSDMFDWLKFVENYKKDKSISMPDSVGNLLETYPKILPVIMLLAENIDSHDFHEYNFMFREDFPVIIDPFNDG